jgi:hypothetical protein
MEGSRKMTKIILNYTQSAPPSRKSLWLGRISLVFVALAFSIGAFIWILVLPFMFIALVASLAATIMSRGRSIFGWVVLGFCGLMIVGLIWAELTGR